jgi:prepilin-type N-terminal cleavage/methylation domain-containing protein
MSGMHDTRWIADPRPGLRPSIGRGDVPYFRTRCGFTLVEVLVGLTVAALALTAGFTALAFVNDRSAEAEQASVAALEGSAPREMLASWLSGARLQAANRAGVFDGIDGDDQGKDSDELTFPTTARTPLGVRNSVVRLFIDDDDETPERGLVAELRERLQDEVRRVELVPQAATLQIRYLPNVPNAVEWQDNWQSQGQLPRAIELTLTPVAGDSLPLMLRLPLRVTLMTLQ